MIGLRSKRLYFEVAGYLATTVLIGLGVNFFSLDSVESIAISETQILAQKTLGIESFSAITYLGDFYVWAVFSVSLFLYAYFRSKEKLNASVKLIIYFVLITASTALLKDVFARPRPYGVGIVVYSQEGSFAYPSGHASRITGSLMIIQGKKRNVKTALIVAAVFAASLSRIVLGAHFPSDTVGAVFLSLAVYKVSEVAASHLLRSVNEKNA